MTLAGYPRDDLYPADDLYPGIPQPQPSPSTSFTIQVGDIVVKLGELEWST